MRTTGFSIRWILASLAASVALHAAAANAETAIVRLPTTTFAAPSAYARSAAALRTVVLPEVTVRGSAVQALPRGKGIPGCGALRGVVSHGLVDSRGVRLPSAARCL